MNATIKVTTGSYGFGHNWALVCKTAKKERVFYLGQDAKACSRILGMSPREVINKIGTAEIDEGMRGNKKLAQLFVEHYGLTGHNIAKIEAWQLSAE